jgi:putative endonuclease
MTKNQNLGKDGESIALNYFLKNNYTILEKNWTFGHLEIDIIAQNGSTIVFCEVKTRTSAQFATPAEAVNKMKQKNIIRAANAYISYKKITLEARFDIITIIGNAENNQLEHIPGAFSPTW